MFVCEREEYSQVCVCVRERGRERSILRCVRERERERESVRERESILRCV